MDETVGWKRLDSRVAYENPWITVREDRVIRPDRKEGIYGVLSTRPAVFIVALTDTDEVLLIHLYRYPTEAFSWEVPAGSSDGGDLLEAAKRELREETGYVAEHWDEVGTFQSLNGVANSRGHVFLARGLSHSGSHEQSEEGITQVKAFSWSEIRQMIRKGSLDDAETMASLMIAEGWLKDSR